MRRSAARPEPAQRLGRQLQPAAVADEVALPLQLALDLAQPADVVDGLPAERPAHGLLVDVGQVGAVGPLPEGLLKRLEVGQLGERLGRVGVAEGLVAAHRGPTGPAGAEQVRPGGPQPVLQPGHLRSQVEVGEGLLGELAELRALLG